MKLEFFASISSQLTILIGKRYARRKTGEQGFQGAEFTSAHSPLRNEFAPQEMSVASSLRLIASCLQGTEGKST
jgi:hypothetical protein